MIGPEIEPGPLPHPAGDGVEKVRLQQPVLLMALFRPRIREKHPDFLKGNPRRKRVEEFQGVGAYKVTIGKIAALGFPEGPGNPIARQVDADTEAVRKFRGVTLEKMAMTAAYFPDDRTRLRQEGGELGPQCSAPLGDELDKFRFEIHAPYSS